MTPAQWLTEYEVTGRTRIYRLPAPLTFRVATPAGNSLGHVSRTSLELFRQLGEIAREDRIVLSASWGGHKLTAHGLHALNVALRQPAFKRDGRNIVRHWLEEVSRVRTPLPGHWESLLAYLEIRPVPARKNAQPVDAKHYVSTSLRHKARRKPRHAKH